MLHSLSVTINLTHPAAPLNYHFISFFSVWVLGWVGGGGVGGEEWTRPSTTTHNSLAKWCPRERQVDYSPPFHSKQLTRKQINESYKYLIHSCLRRKTKKSRRASFSSSTPTLHGKSPDDFTDENVQNDVADENKPSNVMQTRNQRKSLGKPTPKLSPKNFKSSPTSTTSTAKSLERKRSKRSTNNPSTDPAPSPSCSVSKEYAEARKRLHVSSVPDSLPCRVDEFQQIAQVVRRSIESCEGICLCKTRSDLLIILRRCFWSAWNGKDGNCAWCPWFSD